ncbi:MAG: hypothetical protein R6U61_04905 [Thermoplasmata archaeon]
MPRSSNGLNEKQCNKLIKKLSSQKKEELDKELDGKKEKLEIDLSEEYENLIKSQMNEDLEEIDAFNIMISAFMDNPSYSFIRTEPLIYYKLKNFDLLIGSSNKDKGILIEYERTLLIGLFRKLNEFFQERDVVKYNKAEFDVKTHLDSLIGSEDSSYDFVIASLQLKENKLQNIAEDLGENFISWGLSSSGNTCRMYSHINKKTKEEDFNGHSDPELEKYINNELIKGKPYIRKVSFTYSSSRWLKLKDTVTVLTLKCDKKDNKFDYNLWKKLFKVELLNYSEKEKKTTYRNIIEYGLDCGIFSKEEDVVDIFVNEYRVRTRYTKNIEKLEEEIISKMKTNEMNEELESRFEEIKKELVMEYYRDYSTGGVKLTDFGKN